MNCFICGNPVEAPKKRIINGVIVEQCVAQCHDRHIQPCSNAEAFLAAAKKAFKKAGCKRV